MTTPLAPLTHTHTHMEVDFLFHSKPHSAKEIFNFPAPVNMLFYLSCFDLQTEQSCALGAAVQKGDWALCVSPVLWECWQVMGHTFWPFLHFIFEAPALGKSLPHLWVIVKTTSDEAWRKKSKVKTGPGIWIRFKKERRGLKLKTHKN